MKMIFNAHRETHSSKERRHESQIDGPWSSKTNGFFEELSASVDFTGEGPIYPHSRYRGFIRYTVAEAARRLDIPHNGYTVTSEPVRYLP